MHKAFELLKYIFRRALSWYPGPPENTSEGEGGEAGSATDFQGSPLNYL